MTGERRKPSRVVPVLLVYLCREVLGLPGLGAYLEKKQPQQQAELRGTPS